MDMSVSTSASAASKALPIAAKAYVVSLQQAVDKLRDELVQQSLELIKMPAGASAAQLRAQLNECTLSLQSLQHSLARVQGLAAPTGSYPTVLIDLDDLPLFQWTGMVLDRNVHVFPDLSDCLIRFEDTLLMYGLTPDPHFLRFIPVKLFGEAREWYSLFLSSFLPNAPSYEQFKVAIMERFKPITHQNQLNCALMLIDITMNPDETVASFVNRFEYLCYRCGDLSPSNSALFDAFLKAMTPKFSEKLDIVYSLAPSNEKKDLPRLLSCAVSLERSMSTFYGLLDSSPSATHASRRRNHGRVNKRSATKKFCKFHKHANHNTKDCRALAAAFSATHASNSTAKTS